MFCDKNKLIFLGNLGRSMSPMNHQFCTAFLSDSRGKQRVTHDSEQRSAAEDSPRHPHARITDQLSEQCGSNKAERTASNCDLELLFKSQRQSKIKWFQN
jgi:hypothetical protein